MAEFEARAVNSNGTLSRTLALSGDEYEDMFSAAGIDKDECHWHDVEELLTKFENFCGFALADFARALGGRDGVDEDHIHDTAEEVRKFLKDLIKAECGFCAGSPPTRPLYAEKFVRRRWER